MFPDISYITDRGEVEKMRKFILFLLPVLFLLTSCADLFQTKIAMGPGSNGSLSDIFVTEKEITKLDSSSQVFVSSGLATDSISISWHPVDYAVSYCLERAVQTPEDPGYSEGKVPENFEVINKAVYGTSYTDVILSNPSYTSEEYGYKYWYRVYAENNREKYEASDPALCSKTGTMFAPPGNVDATKGAASDNIRVTWDFANNASGYVVYRTKNSDGTGAEEKARITGNQNWYKDTIEESEQGVDFYYIVKAVNSAGVLSEASNIGLGYSLMSGAPQMPSPVKVLTRGTSISEIKLKWDASASGEGEVKYAVFRYSSIDSSLTQLTSGTTACEWTDKNNVKPGILYYYQVQAWVEDETGKKLKSQISTVDPFEGGTDETSEGFLLSPPSGIGVAADQTGHSITWQPAIGHETEQALYEYEIYGSDRKDDGFAFLCRTAPGECSAELAGTSKFYRIKTLYASVSSSESDTVAPAPFAAENVSASRAENLGDAVLYPANSSGVYPVKITWEPPQGGASAYHVYRSTTKDSGFRKITDVPVTDCEFVDKNDTAKAGKYYYYRVLALNELEQGNNYSETKVGYGALTHEQYILEFNKTILSSQKKLKLMHKPSTSALGSEEYQGDISGKVYYNATLNGLSARIIIQYTDYADSYIDNNKDLGPYFVLSGNSNTSANTSANGGMDGTINCTGMYPGSVSYDGIEIKGGDAGGGTYGVKPVGFKKKDVSWTVLN